MTINRTPVANAYKSGNIFVAGDYYVQNYTVNANIEISSYDVAITGFPNGTIVTDTNENGEATTKDYPIRDYEKLTITETKTGKWYVLNETPQKVTLKEDEITNITFTNEKKKGQIRVINVDKF